jgi:hypothetical protein
MATDQQSLFSKSLFRAIIDKEHFLLKVGFTVLLNGISQVFARAEVSVIWDCGFMYADIVPLGD